MTEVKKVNDFMLLEDEWNEFTKDNGEHKEQLFKFIFGNKEHKEWILSLYNVLNHSDYTDSDEIKFTTVDNFIYMSMKNDFSFLVGNSINLYEQLLNINPNIPVLFFIYLSKVYAKILADSEYAYQLCSGQQKLSAPQNVCFYNGRIDKEDKIILNLSDSHQKPVKSDLNLKVTMLNINCEKNKDMLNACQPLKEYLMLADNIRKYGKEYTIDDAVDKAIDELPENAVIKPFLLSNIAEVKRMCIKEYDEAETLAHERMEV